MNHANNDRAISYAGSPRFQCNNWRERSIWWGVLVLSIPTPRRPGVLEETAYFSYFDGNFYA